MFHHEVPLVICSRQWGCIQTLERAGLLQLPYIKEELVYCSFASESWSNAATQKLGEFVYCSYTKARESLSTAVTQKLGELVYCSYTESRESWSTAATQNLGRVGLLQLHKS